MVCNADLNGAGSPPGGRLWPREPRGVLSPEERRLVGPGRRRALCCLSVVSWSFVPGLSLIARDQFAACSLFREREVGREGRGTRGRAGDGEVGDVSCPAWWVVVPNPSDRPLTLRPGLPGGGPGRVWVGSEGRVAAPGPPSTRVSAVTGPAHASQQGGQGNGGGGVGDRPVCTKPANWYRRSVDHSPAQLQNFFTQR